MSEDIRLEENENEDRIERLESMVERLEQDLVKAVESATERALNAEPMTPSKRIVDGREPRITVRDRFDRAGYTDADIATALLLEDAVRRVDPRFRLPEDLKARAMSVSGNPEWVGETFLTSLWESVKNEDGILDSIPSVPMSAPTLHVPVDTTIPKMYSVDESTADSASAYPTSDPGTGRRTLNAKKFTIQTVVSGEMSEDSLVPFIPILRNKLITSAALHLGSAMLNGDTATEDGANINAGGTGQTPSANAHYLAFNGIRKYAIANGKLIAASANLTADINKARALLSGQNNAVDDGVQAANWGRFSRNLRLVCDFDTYLKLLNDGLVVTVDKYGPNATVVNGELGSVFGIPVLSPAYCTPTMPSNSGKASKNAADNTVGQIVIFAPEAFLRGIRRDVQIFVDRIQRTDQLLLELYVRVGFERHGENVSAVVHDVDIS
jgi:HK97 family phage major capsid protein